MNEKPIRTAEWAGRPMCSAVAQYNQQPCARRAADAESGRCGFHGGQKKTDLATDPTQRKCVATKNKSGGKIPCGAWAIKGGRVCRFHGGQYKQVIKAANRRLEIAAAQDALASYGLPVVGIDPFEALLEEIARTAGHVRWLQATVQELPPEDLIWGKTTEEHSVGDDAKGTYDVVKHEAIPHIWMQLYQKERTHLVHVCKVAIQCGIAERQVKLAEQQGEIMVKLMKSILNDPELALTAEQQAVSAAVAGRHLRLVSGGADGPSKIAS